MAYFYRWHVRVPGVAAGKIFINDAGMSQSAGVRCTADLVMVEYIEYVE